jgi:hypothetical protein
MAERADEKTCPTCGQGTLLDITYREGDPAGAGEPIQTAEARQVETYSCGHEIVGPALDRTAAGTEDLEAERRASEETSEPL